MRTINPTAYSAEKAFNPSLKHIINQFYELIFQVELCRESSVMLKQIKSETWKCLQITVLILFHAHTELIFISWKLVLEQLNTMEQRIFLLCIPFITWIIVYIFRVKLLFTMSARASSSAIRVWWCREWPGQTLESTRATCSTLRGRESPMQSVCLSNVSN